MATRGLILLAKNTFSGVSSVSFDNVFSATYKLYKIVTNFSGSGAYTYMRMRAGGSDNTSTNYNRQFLVGNHSTITAGRSTSVTRWDGVTELNTTGNIALIEIINPFQSAYTNAISKMSEYNSGNIIFISGTFGLTVTTSYDGFTIAPDTSTITGNITVYGLAQ